MEGTIGPAVHEYENGAVPPVMLVVAVPLHNALQVMLVDVAFSVITPGSVIVMVTDCVQPFASVTSTV
jgi:citrate lyase alpha subunit